MLPLPIDPSLAEIVASLRETPTLVIDAPPGAGKTTRVPRALLEGGFAARGQILVVEPRRLAARLGARRVAEELGEAVGGTVGYSVHLEEVSSERTRIRFVTEGVVERTFLASPRLESVAVIVFDEVHERHVQGDVALAIAQRIRQRERPDLRIVAMSATLATEPLAAFLGAPVIRTVGRRFDVAMEHLPSPDDRPLSSQVASAVRRLVIDGLSGDVLIFLPGAAEIRQSAASCEKIATEAGLRVVVLHGDLSSEEQDAAVCPQAQRKLIVSTNVAESSITIDGVVAVIDSGLARVASHASWSGLPRLRVEKVSQASATQRAGRAGRTRPGRCLRLYTRADFESRPKFDVPEILRADLAQSRLLLTALSARDVDWLDPPPEASVRASEELLLRLGAADADGNLTRTGREMLRFALHPRLARVCVEGEKRGIVDDACLAAAILSEGEIRLANRARFGDARAADVAAERSDLEATIDLFREVEDRGFTPSALRAAGLDPGATQAVKRGASHLTRTCRHGLGAGQRADAQTSLGMALLAGYPDRVARRVRPGSRQLALATGGLAELSELSAVRHAEWLIAIDAEERPSGARSGVVVRIASAIEPEWLIDVSAHGVREQRQVVWNAQAERVEAREVVMWENLILYTSERANAPPEETTPVLREAALAAGPSAFAAPDVLERWLARTRFAASVDPSVSAPTDENVRETLASLCEGRTSFAELRAAGLLDALQRASGVLASSLDRLAPERTTLAAGRSVVIRYESGRPPSIASRIQDFFGMSDGPRVGRATPLVLELLAPNRRAVQVTTDLAGFWQRHYPAIRKELMRKYPKHKWPEKP
ncbi:MAG: ATP-dependent helicase HrpB [Polyangiaceae bacterium]|jgi:ATP-dependent helicase HrpB